MNDAWFYQIKAAQRDLIKMAGGLDRAVELTSFARSVVGRWNNPGDPDLMPLQAVRTLEKETDQPLITTIMAHETGRKILEPKGPVTDAAALDQLVRQALMQVSELATEATIASTDGFLTHSEATTVGNPASRLRDTVRQIEQLVGAVKAAGGAPADLRIVAGD